MLSCLTLVILKWKVRGQDHCQNWKFTGTKQNAGTGKKVCQGHVQKMLLSDVLNGSLSIAENKPKKTKPKTKQSKLQ